MTTFNLNDTVAVFGNQPAAVQAMLDYDYICGKEQSSLRCLIQPGMSGERGFASFFYGGEDVVLPVFADLHTAIQEHAIALLVNFASSRSAYSVTVEALQEPSIKTVVVIAEGMAEREARLMKMEAMKLGKRIVGPATVGGIIPGLVKTGNAGGTIENCIANRLFVRGSVGIASKSGGMLNELMTLVTRNSDGVAEAIAVGGDRFPGTTLSEQVRYLQENPDVKLILLLGEVGGTQEYEIAQDLKEGTVNKPLVAWVSGTGGKLFDQPIQFGHAGAKAHSEAESSEAKIAALREAGATMPNSYAELESVFASTARNLGLHPNLEATPSKPVPQDFAKLRAAGQLRYPKQIVTSIAAKKDGEATYNGQEITKVSAEHSIGHILGLLWFKQEFPEEVGEFFELILRLTADHGAAVSGAHNTIVAARAGKDLVSSLVSGLLTIGPRFGGAVNQAAFEFKRAADAGMSAYDFVAEMKEAGKLIPGIGHRVKSRTNPDERVTLLKERGSVLAKEHMYTDFALQVEEVTTRKKDSLILNVDGTIAVELLDILSQYLTSTQIDDLIAMEAFNAFFVLGRSIGLLGHFIDQRRLNQPLYRHPEWDIMELD